MPTIEISNGSYNNGWLYFNVNIGDYPEAGNEIFMCNIKLDGEYIYCEALQIAIDGRIKLNLSNGDEDSDDIGERDWDGDHTTLSGSFRLTDEQLIGEYADTGGVVTTIYPFKINYVEYEGERYTEFNYE